MRRLLVVAWLAAACGQDERVAEQAAKPKPAEPPKRVQEPHKIDALRMTVPAGWAATYDRDSDQWRFETPTVAEGGVASARIERAPTNAVASPDAYLAQRRKQWDGGTKAEIESRQSVKDGFAMTVIVRPAGDPARPKRETYVVRQLGNVWYQCMSEWVPDDAVRDQLVALCKSLKL